jgi:hypothetical protein
MDRCLRTGRFRCEILFRFLNSTRALLMMSADESPNSCRAKDMASFTNHSLIHNQAATQAFHRTVNHGPVY